jgi:hypothetical protein
MSIVGATSRSRRRDLERAKVRPGDLGPPSPPREEKGDNRKR